MLSSREAFPNMADILKEGETENFKLEHFVVTAKGRRFAQLKDMVKGRDEHYDLRLQKYIKLVRKSGSWFNIVMSDTPMEKRTAFWAYDEARGDVLIGGLGLGMLVMGIQDKPKVDSIIVVEKEQEVIDLVGSQLPLNEKVTIVHGDIFEYTTDKKFDTLFFDIWDNLCSDNWLEMKKLHAKFRRNRKKGSWMSSWRKRDHQDQYRIDKKQERGWRY